MSLEFVRATAEEERRDFRLFALPFFGSGRHDRKAATSRLQASHVGLRRTLGVIITQVEQRLVNSLRGEGTNFHRQPF
jgi:hypothetical protein